ncbi:aminotransferase class I/II-fold pyridoxal phosphate-dependent enzyme [Devosia sp. BK]|uniref:pyridoxal phosphate-dependent aminotransferase n=1 Tax=Devosia sp. BK TaxID=2871706 RepID=UPI00293A8860|nr:aminotransferase class I/II-fold pyridoxal phosphate-dependent enzyme [Devosia sp. BK]MDV3250908.1 aminotransferase class I/II-fold pyridoxal phosphate-dependent enzyme [Devosia sp. BK]
MTAHSTDGLMPFLAMDILNRAKVLEGQGRTICHLELGEPGQPPAPKVLEAVARALPNPQGYTSAKGLPALREELAHYYERQHNVAVSPDLILATMGSSAGFILAFHTAFRPGARIAITRPGYPAYINTIIGLGFQVAEIPVSAANNWHLTGAQIEAAYNKMPFDGLLFASPANPTGSAVDRAGLADIIDTCKRLGITFISDEIYHGLDYRGPSISALELTRDAIVINSFSKYYCMTGWRIGWMVLPESLVRRAEVLQQNLFISAPTLSQIAATAALGERDYSEEQKAIYAENRRILTKGLQDLGFDLPAAADGAFYAYAGISKFSNDSLAFCESLLEQAGIASTPGVDFDRTSGQGYIRFSYAGTSQTIELALERLDKFLKAGA